MARRKKPAPPPPPRRRRGSGSVAVLKDGTIRARLPASIDPARPSREFRAGCLAEAVAWLDAALLAPTEATAAPLTLREWAGTWHEAYVAPVRAPTTARRYLHSLRLLEPLYGTPLAEVRPLHLQAVVGRAVAVLGPSTVVGAVGVWRRLFDAAIDDGRLARNPARQLVLPIAGARGAERHVTPQEMAKLWPAIRGHRFEGGFALLLGCGLRIGEVLGLPWSNVHLDEGWAWIEAQWTDHRMRSHVKGRNPHRIALPPRVVAALGRHRRRQHAGAVLVMESPHPGRRHKGRRPQAGPHPWSAETVRADWAAVARAAGITPFSAHATRRGLVSALLDGGVSPAVVAERVGHASPATTLRHYAKVSPEARQRADAVVERYLGDDPGAVSDDTVG